MQGMRRNPVGALAELNLKNERLQNAQLNQALEMKRRDITDYALVYSSGGMLLRKFWTTSSKSGDNPIRELYRT